MKTKLLILITTMLAFQHLQAQDYIPLAVEGAHWIIVYDRSETIEPVDGIWEYYAEGDTLINNIIYAKIYKRNLVITQDGPPFEADGPYILYGFIRDDSNERKVYAIKFHEFDNCPVNEEYLIFDFSLNVGDTVHLCLLPDFFDYVISSITEEYYYGIETRIFSTDMGVQLFEGIGSNYGLFEEMFAPFKTQKNRYIYSTFLEYYCRESPCDLLVSLPEASLSGGVSIYPNPSSNYVVFELPVISNPSAVALAKAGSEKKSPQITITNTLGQQIAQLEVKGNKTVWDARTIQAGVYFYFLEIGGKRYSGKVIVQK